MFKRQINYEKLQFKLQICVQRLDLILKRKKLRSLRKRTEIIHLVKIHKKKKARAGIEQIIPIDCIIEAGIVLKQLCTLIKENISELDGSLHRNLIEAIYCIVWAAPYLKHEVIELEHVAHLLSTKFGKLCKSFKNKNITYDNLKKKLILARSGHWLSPKIIEDYFVQLMKHYETKEVINGVGNCHSKIFPSCDQWGNQTISHPPRVSGDDKIGYRRPSTGSFVTERPWTTMRKPNTISDLPTLPTASTRKHVPIKDGFNEYHKEVTSESSTNMPRSSKIPIPTAFLRNKSISRSNSLSEPRSRRSLLSLSSIKSISGSLTSLKSLPDSPSTSSVFAEEYVSILDILFNFDKNTATDPVISEEPYGSSNEIDISNPPDWSSRNWGIQLL